MARLVLLVLIVGGALALGVRPVHVFAPLLGLVILRIGLATFSSLEAGAAHIPSEDPRPVDLARERTVFTCEGCGAEVLLLVQGTPMPPRHCGERMTPRREIARDLP